MKLLDENELNIINDILVKCGVTLESLKTDLLDHIACMVEEEINKGEIFENALKNAMLVLDEQEILDTNESTKYLLNLKNKKMKKTTGYIGIISSILIMTGVMFKIMHWLGASILILTGLVLASIIVLPLMAFLSINRKDNWFSIAASASAYFSGTVLIFGTLFKIFHWPYSSILIKSGYAILCFVFIPLYFIKSYKLAENRIFAISQALLIMAGLVLLWGLIPI
jgi:hypothetical protein